MIKSSLLFQVHEIQQRLGSLFFGELIPVLRLDALHGIDMFQFLLNCLFSFYPNIFNSLHHHIYSVKNKYLVSLVTSFMLSSDILYYFLFNPSFHPRVLVRNLYLASVSFNFSSVIAKRLHELNYRSMIPSCCTYSMMLHPLYFSPL